MFFIHPIIENRVLYRFYIRNLDSNEESLHKSIPSDVDCAFVCEIKLFRKVCPNLNTIRLIDINFIVDSPPKLQHDSFPLYEYYQYLYPHLSNIYDIVPKIKILEHFRLYTNKYLELFDYLGFEIPNGFEFYNDKVSKVFSELEQNPILVDSSIFPRVDILEGDYLYSDYNIYNKWSRPTNVIDGFNLTSISSSDGTRKSILPTNDVLLEFDYKSYQINLLANIIGYEFETSDIYKELSSIYKTDSISEAKKKTMYYLFADLDNNPFPDSKFFKKFFDFKKSLTTFVAPSGKKLELEGSNKDIPRILQVVETEKNVLILEQIQEYLKDKESRLVLYFYDSFVIDFSKTDGKSTILKIKEIVQYNAPCTIKYGKNYQDMELLSI